MRMAASPATLTPQLMLSRWGVGYSVTWDPEFDEPTDVIAAKAGSSFPRGNDVIATKVGSNPHTKVMVSLQRKLDAQISWNNLIS